MSTSADPHAAQPGGEPVRRVPRLDRGVTATWWYTSVAILFFELVLVLLWLTLLLGTGLERSRLIIVAVAALVWCASTLVQLLQYRRRAESELRVMMAAVAVSAVAGVVAGLASGWWVVGFFPAVQSLVLVNWPKGIRMRALLAGTVVLAITWFVDTRALERVPESVEPSLWVYAFYTITLPALSVFSLWWWDVLSALDHARAAESRLGAAHERLRIAADVHDLQGHHLQVIALQVELAERLMERDPEAAHGHLRAARESVDAARQETRDLATRFRGVPLPDELANAVDLVEAAGMSAHATVDASAHRAPSAVFGPVVRETTTNILRYGDGGSVTFALAPVDGAWRYTASNSTSAEVRIGDEGSGLRGIRTRLEEAGGRLEIRKTRQAFTVIAEVPIEAGERA